MSSNTSTFTTETNQQCSCDRCQLMTWKQQKKATVDGLQFRQQTVSQADKLCWVIFTRSISLKQTASDSWSKEVVAYRWKSISGLICLSCLTRSQTHTLTHQNAAYHDDSWCVAHMCCFLNPAELNCFCADVGTHFCNWLAALVVLFFSRSFSIPLLLLY